MSLFRCLSFFLLLRWFYENVVFAPVFTVFRGCRLFAPGYFFNGFCSLAVLNFIIENYEKNDRKTNKNNTDLGIAFNTLPGTVSGGLGDGFGRPSGARGGPGGRESEAKGGKSEAKEGEVKETLDIMVML